MARAALQTNSPRRRSRWGDATDASPISCWTNTISVLHVAAVLSALLICIVFAAELLTFHRLWSPQTSQSSQARTAGDLSRNVCGGHDWCAKREHRPAWRRTCRWCKLTGVASENWATRSKQALLQHKHTQQDGAVADDALEDAALQASSVAQAGAAQPKRVALAFYGLTRSLNYTIDSIHQNIMQPLTDAGYQYDVFLHTYNLTRLSSAHSQEEDAAALNTTEWQLLQPDAYSVTSQEEFLDDFELPIQACQTFSVEDRTSASAEDYYNDTFASIQNLMCQLNSLAIVTALWRDPGTQYDAVLYLRPDVLFNCKLPVHLLGTLQQRSIYIADFHHWAGGYNDRFVMGAPDAAAAWGDRLYYALATCMRKQTHAEQLVADVVEHHRLNVEMLPFYFFRVRATGLLANKDAHPAWKSHAIPHCNETMFEPFWERERLANATVAAEEERRDAAANATVELG